MKKTRRFLAIILVLCALGAFSYYYLNTYMIEGPQWFHTTRENIRGEIISFLTRGKDWDEPPTQTVPPTSGTAITDVKPPPSRHYYERLTARQQHAYLAMVNQMPDFPERIEIPPLDKDALAEVVRAYSYDNPAQFNMGEVYTLASVGTKSYIMPDYRYSKEYYEEAQMKMRLAMNEILRYVPAGGSDYEKELAVHNALVQKVSYHNESQPYESTPYGALVIGRAACEGYSRAAKLLLEALGIENILSTGDATNSAGRTEPHMWNTVKISGQWYHLDLTWNDVGDDGDGGWRYDYFNLSDKEISHTHDISGSFISCTATEANYYRKEGLYFENYNNITRNVISSTLKNNLKLGVNQVDVRFSSIETMQNAHEQLTNSKDGEIYRMLKTAALGAKNPVATNTIGFYINEKLGIVRYIIKPLEA